MDTVGGIFYVRVLGSVSLKVIAGVGVLYYSRVKIYLEV